MEFSSGSGQICKPLTSCFVSKSAQTSSAISPRTLCCTCKATVACSSNSKKQNSLMIFESVSGVFSKSETRRRCVARYQIAHRITVANLCLIGHCRACFRPETGRVEVLQGSHGQDRSQLRRYCYAYAAVSG
jgi:hypothetical protein